MFRRLQRSAHACRRALQKKQVSLGKAAELAGLNLSEHDKYSCGIRREELLGKKKTI
jgi:hypothetical protein